MAANPELVGGDAGASSSGSISQRIVLHILSPSQDVPDRITLSNVAVTTRVSELKDMISRVLPNSPDTATQRLIYRGRALLDGGEVLSNILEPRDALVHSLHLVLTPTRNPSPQAPSPDTAPARSLPATNTDHSRVQYGQFPVNAYVQGTSVLRFRGPHPMANVAPTQPSGNQANPSPLHAQLSLLHQQLAEHGRFLTSQFGQPPHPPANLPFANLEGDSARRTTNIPVAAVQVPNATSAIGEHAVRSSVPLPRYDSTGQGGITRSTTITVPAAGSSPAFPLRPPNQNFQNSTATASTQPLTVNPGTPLPDIGSFMPDANWYFRFTSLAQRIMILELQVRQGIIPSNEEISIHRFQLYRLLEEQYRNPLWPRNGAVEGLLSRLWIVTCSADELHVRRVRQSIGPMPQHGANCTDGGSHDPNQTSIYLLSSPSGYQAALIPPADLSAANPIPIRREAAGAGIARALSQLPIQLAAEQVPARAGNVMDQAVNNAIIQQRARIVDHPAFFPRNIRRLWLFVRLYFFCYLLSEGGTWFRTILVTLAVVIAFVSETTLPRRFQRAIFDPVQRHLEHIVPLEVPQAQPRQHLRQDGATDGTLVEDVPRTVTATDPAAAPAAQPGGMLDNLRRVERAVALFLATLVPGVGERHVAARNAAAEAARRNEEELAARREEEQSHRRESEADPQPGDPRDAADIEPINQQQPSWAAQIDNPDAVEEAPVD